MILQRVARVLALLVALALLTQTSPAQLSMTGVGGGFGGAAAGYTGPGNIVSGAVAWFGLRGYNTADTANAANVCLPSDTTCADLTLTSGNVVVPGSLSTCNITTVICTVKTLYDKSGANACGAAACNVTQATEASRPTFRPAMAANGCTTTSLPCMKFSGTQSLANASGFSVTAQPGSFSAVALSNGGGYGTIIGSACEAIFTNFGNDVTTYCSATINHIAATDSVYHTFQNIADDSGGGSFIYVNGSSSAASTGSSVFLTTSLRIGTGTGGLNGNAVEAGVWTVAFNATQAGNMNTNQRAYWGF